MKGKASTFTTIEDGKRSPQARLELYAGGQTRLQTFSEFPPNPTGPSPMVPTKHPAPPGATPLGRVMETFAPAPRPAERKKGASLRDPARRRESIAKRRYYGTYLSLSAEERAEIDAAVERGE